MYPFYTRLKGWMLLLCLAPAGMTAQVVISEIAASGEIKLTNVGTTTENINNYWLCNFPDYDELKDLSIVCGSTTDLKGGESVVVKTASVPVSATSGEMGLYRSSAFTSAAAMVDYVQWGNGNHQRATVAVTAGIWTTGTFVAAFDNSTSLQYDGSGNAVSDWKAAAPVLCNAATVENIKLAASALGQILVDSAGRTLYFFTRDSKADTSFCNGNCPNVWPIFYNQKITPGDGLEAAHFGEITRGDGKKQTTYKGWPLYYYSQDAAAGETKGEGFNGIWFVAKPDYQLMLMNNQLVGNDGVAYNSQYQPGNENVQYFVDAQGRTLYIFSRDAFEKNNFTRADFGNDAVWPVYSEMEGAIASTLDKALFSIIDIHGRKQLAYKGWPLYYFGADNGVRGATKGVSFPAPGIWPVGRKDIKYAPTIVTANNTALGSILTDSKGRTLYYFTRDNTPDTSLCNGNCPNVWPVFYTGILSLPSSLDSADFAEITRADGKKQLTHNGWPLYYYSGDAAAGETKGEGFNNVWYVAKPDYSVMLMNNQLVGADGNRYKGNYEPGDEVVQHFVDGQGRTLYIFIPDSVGRNTFTRADFSNNGVWPIYEVEPGRVASALDGALFDTVHVHGRVQLTYKGWPLYYFGADNGVRGATKGVSFPRPGVWPVAVKDLDFTTNLSTGVQEAFRETFQLALSPVPAQEYLNIRMEATFNGRMQADVYDVMGRHWQTNQLEVFNGAQQTRLGLEQLPKGLYLLRLTQHGQEVAIEKFIKN